MEDYQIVDLYWKKDESAISETDIKYHRLLFSLSRNIVIDERQSEECLNDTYLKAWNIMPPNRPTFLGAFLAKIIRQISIDIYRHTHRLKRGGDAGTAAFEELADCLSAPDDVEENLNAKLLADEINVFLKQYSERNRVLFLRRYFWLDSVAEAASFTGMSQTNAKVTLHRMREALKTWLQERGYAI